MCTNERRSMPRSAREMLFQCQHRGSKTAESISPVICFRSMQTDYSLIKYIGINSQLAQNIVDNVKISEINIIYK